METQRFEVVLCESGRVVHLFFSSLSSLNYLKTHFDQGVLILRRFSAGLRHFQEENLSLNLLLFPRLMKTQKFEVVLRESGRVGHLCFSNLSSSSFSKIHLGQWA